MRQAVHAATSLIQLDRLLERFGQALVQQLTSLAHTQNGAARSEGDAADAATAARRRAGAADAPRAGTVGGLAGWERDGTPAVAYSGRSDLMVACYAGDPAAEVRGYRAHLDNPGPVGEATEGTSSGGSARGDTAARLLTMVTYLNTAWDERTGGGELRLFVPEDVAAAEGCVPAGMAGLVDVVPRADTVVIFRSDLVLHEVRPANQQRLAATLWLHACRGGGGAADATGSFWT